MSAPDWREQAYEDQYWAEKVAVSTWSPETAALFLDAVARSSAGRAAEKAEVIGMLEPVSYDSMGAPLYAHQLTQ